MRSSRKTVYTYKTVDQLKIQADVYRHEDVVKRPVVIWLHGGALIMGSRNGVPKQLQELAREHGFVVVSLDYRLAPEAKLADIIEDLKDGLEWVRTSGPEQFDADSSRIVVAGASAGGYLALMTGLSLRRLSNDRWSTSVSTCRSRRCLETKKLLAQRRGLCSSPGIARERVRGVAKTAFGDDVTRTASNLFGRSMVGAIETGWLAHRPPVDSVV